MDDASRPAWRRSSYSTSGENCVEVAALTPQVAIRDSKNPDGPKLIFNTTAWNMLLHQIKADAHTRP